jgi:geranylgeranyl diphosphate synthase type II
VSQDHPFLRVLTTLQPTIEAGLRRYAWPEAGQGKLRAAMDYSLFAGGKRLRPALVLLAARATAGGDASAAAHPADAAALPVAAAYEMVHTYSLIHDDLPAMDDDDLRRGRPSNHKVYGDATAILAGDAMLTYAFEVLAREVPDAGLSRRLIRVLCESAGLAGMVAGQQDDLAAEGNAALKLADLVAIHRRKTGALITGALVSGALSAGADDRLAAKFKAFGDAVGLAFQVADDILDATATAEELGKSPGKDARAGKLTYPALLGLDGAKAEARRLATEARRLAAAIPNSAALASMADYVVERGK